MSSTLFSQIAIIMLLAAVGYLARKRNVITPNIQGGLSAIVLNIAVPCSILSSANMPLETKNLVSVLMVFVGGMLLHGASILLFNGIARASKMGGGRRIIFSSLGSFQNCVFIGYPVIRIFLPDTGVFFAAFYVIAQYLFFFIYQLPRISGQTGFKPRAVFGNINTIASFLMIALYLAQFKMPDILQSTLSMLAGTSVPLSMLVIGSMLAGFKLRELFTDKSLYLLMALRMLLIPALILLVARAVALPYEVATVLLILSGLPSASMTAMAAEQYQCEPVYAAKGLLLSTLFFVVTIPYLAWLQGLL